MMRRGRRRVISLALSVAVAACAPDPDPLGNDPVPAPRLFAPGIVNTNAREYAITFTPDTREAYFTRAERRGPPSILVTRFVAGAWTTPERAPFSDDRDETPFIAADGRRMLFSSRRFIPGSLDRSSNLWWMERRNGLWSEPAPLPGAVNQPLGEVDDFTIGHEMGATLLDDGTLLYSASVDPDWGQDVYVAELDEHGTYVTPRPLRLNSYGDESSPAVSPDGRYLVFQAYRGQGAPGEQDLYAARREPLGWSEPWPLSTPINSERNEAYPSFSPDGRRFFFASDRDAPGGAYSIYYVDVDALGLERERH